MPASAIISIGNELLLGKTLNTNMAWLAGELALLGVPVEFSLTVKDEAEAIGNALAQCWPKYDLVITTGGLGPTDDDITKQEIARFFGAELVFDPAVWEHVQALFAARNLSTPQINRNQAMVPQGFSALRNDRGTAPGLAFSSEGKCFFAFAGVPLEMRYVFDTQARPIIRDRFGIKGSITQKTLHTHGISESALAELLAGIALPEGVNRAWLPQTGRVDLRFYGNDPNAIDSCIEQSLPLISKYVWGRDEDTPVSVLSALLKARGLTFSAAESCTGGLVQKMVTDPPGASDVFAGGVVAYANQVKLVLLKVHPETLAKYGAVSEECAREMALGIKILTNSATAISVTGVAGPDGGTELKPVGTVCFGFSCLDELSSATQIFSGDRNAIRIKAAEFAILHLVKLLQGKKI